jgi:hypothetical protein
VKQGITMAIGLKKWIEGNPATTLLSVVISAVALSSGATEYLAKQIESANVTQEKVSFLEQKSELENGYNEKIAGLNTEKSQLSQKYEHDIQDLTERLTSIKRGVGEQKSYMNIQVLQIPVLEIRALPSEYKSYDDNNFFVNEPKYSSWAYRLTTEGEAAKSGPFGSLVAQIEQALGEKAKDVLGAPAHLWTGEAVADVTFNFSGESLSATIRPNITLMRITPQIVSQKIKAIGRALSDDEDSANAKRDKNKTEAVVKEIASIKSKQEDGMDKLASNPLRAIASLGADEPVDTSAKIKEIDEKIKQVDELDDRFGKLYAGDTAGFMFLALLVA